MSRQSSNKCFNFRRKSVQQWRLNLLYLRSKIKVFERAMRILYECKVQYVLVQEPNVVTVRDKCVTSHALSALSRHLVQVIIPVLSFFMKRKKKKRAKSYLSIECISLFTNPTSHESRARRELVEIRERLFPRHSRFPRRRRLSSPRQMFERVQKLAVQHVMRRRRSHRLTLRRLWLSEASTVQTRRLRHGDVKMTL